MQLMIRTLRNSNRVQRPWGQIKIRIKINIGSF